MGSSIPESLSWSQLPAEMRGHGAGTVVCLCIAALVLCLSGTRAQAFDSLHIVLPKPQTVIGTSSLLLEARSDLPPDSITHVVFKADYFDAGYVQSDSGAFRQIRTNRLLGIDSTPPYQWIWNLAQIQDHYHHRMRLTFVAHTHGGDSIMRKTSDFVVQRFEGTCQRPIEARYAATGVPHGALSRESANRFESNNNRILWASRWNEDSLFFVFDVHDSAVVPSDSLRWGPVGFWWYGDDIEVLLDVRNSHSPFLRDGMYQIVLHPYAKAIAGMLTFVYDSNFDVGISGELDGTGYRLRLAVPWAALGVQPTPDMRLAVEVVNMDRDNPEGLVMMGTWAGLHLGNHHNASQWCVMTLRKPDAPFAARVGIIIGMNLVLAAGAVLLWGKTKRNVPADSAPFLVAPHLPNEDRNRMGAVTRMAIEAIERNYHEEGFNLNSAAAQLGRNPRYVSSLFKQETGMRFTDFLNRTRLVKADELLRTTNLPLGHIAAAVGYRTAKYFSDTYKKYFATTPNRVRSNPAAD